MTAAGSKQHSGFIFPTLNNTIYVFWAEQNCSYFIEAVELKAVSLLILCAKWVIVLPGDTGLNGEGLCLSRRGSSWAYVRSNWTIKVLFTPFEDGTN